MRSERFETRRAGEAAREGHRRQLLILSGQTPIDPASGLTFDDVVSVQVYLVDMADFQDMNAAYERHFSAPYPARTTIGCASLPLNARVEIGCMAVTRSTTG